MNKPTSLTEQQILARLARINARMAWIAETEAKAAPVNGIGANGEFSAEHALLTTETDGLLDRLRAIGGTLPFDPV